MKLKTTKSIILFGILFTFSSAESFSQNFKDAGTYFEYVGKEFKQISNDMWDYTSASAHGKRAKTVGNKRKELVSQINTSMSKIKSMPAFNGTTSYRDSTVSFLNLNRLVLNEDYAKIVDMEEVAEESYDAMEAYMLAKEKADDKLKAAGDMIDSEEHKFAADNNITLVESKDKIGKKLEEAGKVYKYTNPIYLIFFKSYKQEMYLINAQNKGDVSGMEQNKNALMQDAKEGKKKLEAIKDYKGDLTLKVACKNMLDFYESEAKKYDDISNYFMTKEKVEKIKTSFDAKKDKEKTKSDVDQYNAAANEFNAANKKYNTTNQDLNQSRSKLVDEYNNASLKLTDKFVPKRK